MPSALHMKREYGHETGYVVSCPSAYDVGVATNQILDEIMNQGIRYDCADDKPFVIAMGEHHSVLSDVALPTALAHACIGRGMNVAFSEELPSHIDAKAITTSYEDLTKIASRMRIPKLFNAKARYALDHGISMNFHDVPIAHSNHKAMIDHSIPLASRVIEALGYPLPSHGQSIRAYGETAKAHHIRNAHAVSSLKEQWEENRPDVIIAQMGLAHNFGIKGYFLHEGSFDNMARGQLNVVHVLPLWASQHVPVSAGLDRVIFHEGLSDEKACKGDHDKKLDDLIDLFVKESGAYFPNKGLVAPKPSFVKKWMPFI